MKNVSKEDLIEEKISDLIEKNGDSINKLTSILKSLGIEERELPNSGITLNNKFNEIKGDLSNDVAGAFSSAILGDLLRKIRTNNWKYGPDKWRFEKEIPYKYKNRFRKNKYI